MLLPSASFYTTALFVGVLYFAIVGSVVGIVHAGGLLPWPRRGGELLFVVLTSWLMFTYVRVADFNSARNVVVITAIFIVLCMLSAQGSDIGILYRTAMRYAAVLSLVLFVAKRSWYINSGIQVGEYFSGKIVESIPNVSGILTHPNFTALYFGSALVVEVALWGYRSRKHVSALFVLMCLVVVLTAQGRNAIAATALAVFCVITYRHGRTIWATLAFTGAVIASFVPLVLMVPSYFFGGSPSYEWFSALTNRGALWVVIKDLLPDGFLLGFGPSWTAQAHQLVLDHDITEVTHAHNEVLDLIMLAGLPAVLLYGALCCLIATRIRSGQPPVEGVGLMIVLAFTSITESPLAPYLAHPGVILLIVAIAIVFSEPASTREPDSLKSTTSGKAVSI